MKQYRIDELRLEDYHKIKTYLEDTFGPSDLEEIYWIKLNQNLYSNLQSEHTQCQPYYFAVELQEDYLSCEFLARTKNTIQCNCIQYATEAQRNWLISFIDSIFNKLQIFT